MTANKLTLSYFGGEFRIDLEGDAEYIANERAEFNKSVLSFSQSISQEHYKKSQETPQTTSEPKIEIPMTNGSNTESEQKYESLSEFIIKKNFITGVARILGIGYYIDIIDQNGYFTGTQIQDQLKKCRLPPSTNISRDISYNIKKGYITELDEDGEGEKRYKLLTLGIQYVETYKSEEPTKQKKSNPRKKTSKTPKSNTQLLHYSLDDLHLENYCTLDDLGNAAEKIHVLIYIYTKETGNEMFTHYDIEQILVEKFKQKISNSTIRHALSSMKSSYFDKRTTDGQVQYRLMSDGIKEAERIILEHNPNFIPKP
ncbi:MAG: hypothetical protein E7211_21250 [Clostridium lundense]|nr:hypothetical protein [Clostridium lundense]